MEEKKPMNVKLGSAILIIIILVLIGGILFFAYQNSILKIKQNQSEAELKEIQSKTAQKLQDLQSKTLELQKTIEESKKITANTDENVTTDKLQKTTKNSSTNNAQENAINENNTSSNSSITKNEDKYKEITQELGKECLFDLIKYEKDDEKIILKGEVLETYTITKSEYKNAIKTGKLTFEKNIRNYEKYGGKTFSIYKSDSNYFIKGLELGFHVNETDEKYYIGPYSEFSRIWRKTGDYRKITLDKNTTCVYSTEDEYPDTIEGTVADIFGGKVKSWGGCYKFKFKNEKCIQVEEISMGH